MVTGTPAALRLRQGSVFGDFDPGPLLLLGAPGSGKGTQAKSLMTGWGIPQISTGDILRDNREQRTELGAKAAEFMQQGKLVPDELVNEMVAARLAWPDTVHGYILDGYPRTLGQAEWLDEKLALAAPKFGVIAVNIRVSYNQLLCRITGRRSCPTCQRIYNVYLRPPRRDTVCDVDGTPLVARADDNEAVFAERMRVYETLTQPVVDHYRATSRFADVDGEAPVEEVTAAIVSAVRGMRRAA